MSVSALPVEQLHAGTWGLSWRPAGEGFMRRASHALATPTGVWLVDPIDLPGLDAALAAHGPVAGCLITVDRHERDAHAIAGRHDVPVLADEALGGLSRRGPLERFRGEVPGAPLVSIPLPGRRGSRWWKEAAVWWPDARILVVGESVGQAPYFLIGDEVLGLHPFRRSTPPHELAGLAPDRLLVGHGDGLERAAGPVLDELLREARGRRSPGWRVRAALAARRAR